MSQLRKGWMSLSLALGLVIGGLPAEASVAGVSTSLIGRLAGALAEEAAGKAGTAESGEDAPEEAPDAAGSAAGAAPSGPALSCRGSGVP